MEYRNFMMSYEIYSIKIASLIGIVYSLLFMLIDYSRYDDFDGILYHRSFMIFILGAMFYTLNRYKFKPWSLYNLTVFICIILYLITFSMDRFGALPSFFLPNFICLLFYVFNTALGFPLKMKYALNFSIMGLYVLYSYNFSTQEIEHLSQAWNVMLNIFISLFIGYLIERYKRLNFIQKKEIEELSTIKTKLISILSHDLNSPLNNLNGLLYLNENNELTQEELSKYFGKVRKAIDSVSFLMQNLLRWSRTQLQGFVPNIEKIDAKKTVEDVLYTLENIAAEKTIILHNNVDQNHLFYADEEMVKLVLRNILTNSIKFSFTNSTITITSCASDTRCTISIKDSGVGIIKNDLEALFSFKKQSKPGTQNESGTGIGLMLSKEFVDKMGGSIYAESEFGKGATFHITLPLINPKT